MKVLQERPKLERREVDSILEMIDIRTGVIQTLHRFPLLRRSAGLDAGWPFPGLQRARAHSHLQHQDRHQPDD